MCSVCGCGEGEVRIDGHEHGHHHHRHHDNRLAPVAPAGRLLTLEQDILAANNHYAAGNRQRFNDAATLALNLVSSPGSGKTALLTRTLSALADEWTMAVIEGDQQTSNDAERIRATGARAVQINTGKGCHLDAHMVGHALDELLAQQTELLFIENVGNLVCPAAFDLGEARRVVILSVTEGEDKPLKYPDIFAGSDLMILNKCDLLPHLEFDVAQCIDYARRINPRMHVIQLSARSGEGCEQWYQWLRAARQMQRLQG
jgi:hydrogenase nickel incorporation protein HypB